MVPRQTFCSSYALKCDGFVGTPWEKNVRYLALLAKQTPIESSFIKALPDHLNAEVSSGTVTTVDEVRRKAGRGWKKERGGGGDYTVAYVYSLAADMLFILYFQSSWCFSDPGKSTKNAINRVFLATCRGKNVQNGDVPEAFLLLFSVSSNPTHGLLEGPTVKCYAVLCI